MAALQSLEECFKRCRENFLVMLPEIIPALHETLEDQDAAVDKQCKAVIKLIEELSGESLDTYLS